MWNASYLKQQFCVFFVFLLSLVPVTADGLELIGVLPISNQRAQNQFVWLEYYTQARIESNLRNNSNWLFHNHEVMHLWKSRTDTAHAVSHGSTVLIQGNFQFVLEFGHLELQAKRYLQTSIQENRFEQTFEKDELDQALDTISENIGKWINPDFSLSNKITNQAVHNSVLKKIYKYRARLYMPKVLPSIQQTLFLKEVINEKSPPNWIADLAKGMIILSQYMSGKDKIFLLKQSNLLLRGAIKANNLHSRLYSLLAETYYFNNDPPAWIINTAQKAAELDPQNDLAYILILSVKKPETHLPYDPLAKLRSANPWLWDNLGVKASTFQKGILNDEIEGLRLTQ